jgi:hypothetical protein
MDEATEIKKLTERAQAAEARADTLAADYTARTTLEGALRDAGVKAERIPLALRLVDLAALEVNGTEVSGVTEAVETVRATSPEWFGRPVFSAPDASHDGSGHAEYRTASHAEYRRELARYNLRPLNG